MISGPVTFPDPAFHIGHTLVQDRAAAFASYPLDAIKLRRWIGPLKSGQILPLTFSRNMQRKTSAFFNELMRIPAGMYCGHHQWRIKRNLGNPAGNHCVDLIFVKGRENIYTISHFTKCLYPRLIHLSPSLSFTGRHMHALA